MKLTFGAKVNMQSVPSTPPYVTIKQCLIEHRNTFNFLGFMSLFKCNTEDILDRKVNVK
jgi:hypothetical protein